MLRFFLLVLFCATNSAFAGDIFTTPTVADLPALIDSFEDHNVRLGASKAIATLGKSAVPALIEAVSSDDVDVQIWSVYTLGLIGPDASVAAAAVAVGLHSQDTNLRAAAARSLGRIGASDQQTVDLLGKAATDDDTRVRRWSVVALGQLGPSAAAAIPQLIDTLNDQPVRKEAIHALIQIGTPAVPKLTEALACDMVRLEAAEALRQIDPAFAQEQGIDRPTKADLKALRVSLLCQEKDIDARTRAAESLGVLGLEAAAILIAGFAVEEEAVVRATTAAFQNIGPSAVPLLRETIKQDSPSLHIAAIAALAAIGPCGKAATPELISALKDADRDVRHQAVRTLGLFGLAAEPAVPALIAVMHNSRDVEATRQLALKTLAYIATSEDEQIIGALREATEDSNYGISSLAKQMLKRLEASDTP
jgi:HEAT repeat protein